MRHRIETERGDQQHIDFSNSRPNPGGLVDVEFLAFYSGPAASSRSRPPAITHGPHGAGLYWNRLYRAFGLIEEDQSASLRKNYFFLRRLESVLRRAENTSISRIPLDEHEQQCLAKRLGFATVAEFLKTYRYTTRKTREIYEQLSQGS